jgi:hypothetical protein
MTEFLTTEEIKACYDKLLHQPGYIRTLKKSINFEVQAEQILSYAREVHNESIIRIERENGIFHPVTPYSFPPCPLSSDLFNLPDGIQLDAFTYLDQLKYWFLTSHTVIKLLENSYKNPEMTISEQALLMFYMGEMVKKDRGKLYSEQTKIKKKINRVGAEKSNLKNKNKIKRFNKVIEKLSGAQKDQAEKDLAELKINIGNHLPRI